MHDVPKTMKLIDVAAPGGPEQLVLSDGPTPVPSVDEILIEVVAAGVNRADILQRRGVYPSPAGAPKHPGLEVAGTVVTVGHNVTEFEVGDAVCALLQGGGYSQYCVVDAGQVLKIPKGLDFIQGASLPEACFTVWSNVFGFGRLRQGETLLVHGGSSGIGVTAIQIAVALGYAVFTTAGSDEKCRFCEELGARRAINYKSQDFVAEVLQATDNRGVNVVLDMVGGSYLQRNLQALAVEGRLVMIATQGGAKGEADLLRIMQRRLTLTGSTLRAREVDFKRAIKAQLLEYVWPMLEDGTMRPIVDKVFAMSDAPAAHAHMESSAHKGKIILAWSPQ